MVDLPAQHNVERQAGKDQKSGKRDVPYALYTWILPKAWWPWTSIPSQGHRLQIWTLATTTKNAPHWLGSKQAATRLPQAEQKA